MAKTNEINISQSINLGLSAYANWQKDLSESLMTLRKWLQNNTLLDSEVESQFNEIDTEITDETLKIAFVSEFSRGKTELINAIFFADSDHQILPSGAGRTTMCPTEIFYNVDMPLGIQLLPVETLNNKTSLEELKNNCDLWTQLPFDGLNNTLAKNSLSELSKTIRVPIEVAKNLGFVFNDSKPSKSNLVEIPKWRHALINIKHPLTKNNLVIYDTPGLNALGIETKFTLETLHKTHSIVFVLDASIGTSASDKKIWDHYINNNDNCGQIVALNKLDALWNSKTNPTVLREELKRIISSTAKILRIDPDQIHTVSAHNGLIGKLDNNHRLIDNSRIIKLERAIAKNLVPAKKKKVLTQIFPIAQNIAKKIDNNLNLQIDQATQESKINGKKNALNKSVLNKAMSDIKTDKLSLRKEIKCAAIFKSRLKEHIDQINELLSDQFIEASAKEFNHQLGHNSGTINFREKVSDYLLSTYKQLHLAKVKAEEAHTEHKAILNELFPNLSNDTQQPLNLDRHLDWMRSIESKYKAIDRKPGLGQKKQSQRIRRLFESVSLATARALRRARNESNNWYLITITPYENKVRQQTQKIKRRLKNIQQIDSRLQNEVIESDSLNSKQAQLIKKKRQLYALIHNINSHLVQLEYNENNTDSQTKSDLSGSSNHSGNIESNIVEIHK